MYVTEKDAGEKQMFRRAPLLRFLPYYLISNSVPYLITHQVLPRNYGYVIRREAQYYTNLPASLTHLYQFLHTHVKKNFLEFSGTQEGGSCGHFLRKFDGFCPPVVWHLGTCQISGKPGGVPRILLESRQKGRFFSFQ